MKKIILNLLLGSALLNCAVKKDKKKIVFFQSVSVDTIFKDKISIRAVLIDSNKIWYAGDKGRFGFYSLQNDQKFENTIKDNVSESLEFRSIAKTPDCIFILSIGNPGLLYKISKDGKQTQLVYQENNEKVFYDSMQFWNDSEGIAVGDPVENCFSIIITRDGGNTWKKTECADIPKIVKGETAFAASNTNIIVNKNNTWIVSGGKAARIFYSPDKGKSWQAFETPIVAGSVMTGIFTADFYDEFNGFVAGGNYEMLNENSGNKASTKDGGKTWELVAENTAFGYASCVQYVPGSEGKQLVSVGYSGLQYSADSGKKWVKFLDNKDLYTIRFLDKNTAIATGKNNMVRIHFE